jgi:predicted O-methyltransferase YrrM
MQVDYNDIMARGNRRMTRADLELLWSSCEATAARTIVEIGSMDGCSTMLLGLWAAEQEGKLYSVEPRPKNKCLGNIREYGLESVVVRIAAFSPWIERSDVPCPIDLLLIDGDHRTSRAIADYIFWGRFVRKGGRIAFHDIDGGKGVAADIRAAVAICERDDNLHSEQGPDRLIRQVARTPLARDRGLIVYEKGAEAEPWS